MSRLDQIEARANAATPGPWEAGCNDRRMYHVVTENEEFCQTYGPELYDSQGFFSDDDTEFIAHARTDVPALVASLKKVLELHQETTISLGHGLLQRQCVCGSAWPCLTVAAIRQHIGDDL